jgi:hypothetical protein
MSVPARELERRYRRAYRRLFNVAWLVCVIWLSAIPLVAGKASGIAIFTNQMRWSDRSSQPLAPTQSPSRPATRRCRQKDFEFKLIGDKVEVVLKSPLLVSIQSL